MSDVAEYWHKCAMATPNDGAALVAMGVVAGITMMRDELKECITVAPSLMSGDEAIERLKQINVHIHAALRT